MRKIRDIGGEPTPGIHADQVAEAAATEALEEEVLEPLSRAIDAARPQTAAPVANPFAGNPLDPETAQGPSGPRRRVWVASVLFHVAGLALLMLVPEWGTPPVEPEPIEIAFYSPEALATPPAPELEPEPIIEPELIPEPELAPELALEPEPPVETQPLPEPEPIVEEPTLLPPAPDPVVAEALPEPEPVPEPVQPRRVVQTNLLAQPATPPEPKPAKAPRTTQMAGFARAETVAAKEILADRQVPRAGSFTADDDPEPAKRIGTPDNRVVAAGKFTDGPVTVPREGVKPRPRTVAKASFTGDSAVPQSQPPTRSRQVVASNFADDGAAPAAAPTGKRGSVTSIGFNAPVAARTTSPRQRAAADLDTPVEILSKTNPLYTDQARELRIEGEVVLEVRFDASGTLTVLRVVEGLGHGLDEAAISAAEDIEFKPAKQNGQPVDYTATLRVVFRLA